MKKRIAALALLAVLAMSMVPAALADNDARVNLEVTVDDDSDDSLEIQIEIESDAKVEIEQNGVKEEYRLETTDIDVVLADVAARVDLSVEEVEAIAEIEIESRSGDSDDSRFEYRTRTRINDGLEYREEIRLRVEHAKEIREEVRERIELGKNALHEARIELEQCKEDNCIEAKFRARVAATEHLEHIAEEITASIDRLEAQVADNSHLSAEEKVALQASLENAKADVAAQLEVVASIDEEATTAEEIREITASLKQTWQDIRLVHKQTVAYLVSARFDAAVATHEHILERMNSLTVETDDQAVLDAQAAFQAHADAVAEAIVEADATLDAVADGEATLEEWHRQQLEIQNLLKESHQLLRDFMVAYRASIDTTLEV